MKLPTAQQMRQLDRTAIEEYSIPGLVLMENAGRGTVAALRQQLGEPAGRTVAILVGPGNNGGDGLVIARHLHQLGALPRLLLLAPDKLAGDAAVNLAIVRRLGLPMETLGPGDDLAPVRRLLRHSWLAVDALFGTGLKRPVEGHFAAVIELLNEVPVPVVAVDIPSGLDADNGRPLGACVRADLTVTFALPKPGLVAGRGRQLAGRLEVVDIGIPPAAVHDLGIATELLTPALISPWLPRREAAAHKGTFGHLLAVAGAEGKTGAAILCGQGALRAGTGLVTLAVPKKCNSVFETALTEAMTLPLAAGGGRLSIDDYETVAAGSQGKQALAVGPGLGTATETAGMVLRLYRECSLPMVVDADGLNILAANPEAIAAPPAPRILTPHPGEMGRLAGRSSKEVQADRLGAAAAFAREYRVYLVLKGEGTIIAAPDGRLAINPTGNPGMAAGGMGDVLTGIIGGLLAQGLDPWQAACLGVYAHGAAGDRLAAAAPFGFLAAELARELPAALADLAARAS
ncbi:MAG: NAD(P)H-hydrate dehydratase [Desulfobacteraceae bacterium]|nr:NAD(P)H-hydrate dehydratase [Desulfobacteraceae bacterium]